MASHYFDDECSLVATCGAGECVRGIDDSMKSGVSADGHVGAVHVVVNGSDHAGNCQKWMFSGLCWCDLATLQQCGHMLLPLLPQHVCSGETAVATDDDQAVDVMDKQVSYRQQPAFFGAEFLAPGRSDDGAATVKDAANRSPIHRADALSTIDHPSITFVYRKNVGTSVEGSTDNCTHSRVHAGRIAPAG